MCPCPAEDPRPFPTRSTVGALFATAFVAASLVLAAPGGAGQVAPQVNPTIAFTDP